MADRRPAMPGRIIAALRTLVRRRAAAMAGRSRRIVTALPAKMELLAAVWIMVVTALAGAKIALAPVPPANLAEFAGPFLVYALIALAPVMAWRLASRAYPENAPVRRLDFHLSALGRWTPVEPHAARTRPEFGPFGLMACLLVGLLLNVPLRSLEFFLAVPAVLDSAPGWTRTVFLIMAGDVIAMSFLYVTCFVMALRGVALFPRMLLATWMIDIMMQLTMASAIAARPDLPPEVAPAMQELLRGNLLKVLVSMGVWLPYLVLSDRINLTYRYRIRSG